MNNVLEQTEVDTVEKHMDEPIKKCVVGLNLLGITTTMSCCGYTYENEAVPKSHLNKAYVYLDMTQTLMNQSVNLITLALKSNWVISPLGHGIVDFYANGWEKDHPWNNPKSPHFYEVFLLAINRLEKSIDSLQEKFNPQVTISDGNLKYRDEYKIKHWKYKPAADWIVTPETYENL